MNQSKPSKVFGFLAATLLLPLLAPAQAVDTSDRNYRLGPDDKVSVRVQELDKLQLDNVQAPVVDVNGNLSLPLIGRIHASGLTLGELEKAIAERLGHILQHPSVSVSVVQYRNHPVSVLGAVRNPGVIQVTQHRRLLEVVSLAGGLSPDAGDKIRISRNLSEGVLPLAGTLTEPPYSISSVDVRTLMQASNPGLNIELVEGDVVTVPRAELIYVIGAVKKAGGFSLGEREKISVVQAVSMAEGLERTAAPKNARILRADPTQKERKEIAVNLKPIISGHAPDVALQANDILYIPTSAGKVVTTRSLETAVQLGTGLMIWR